MSLRERTAESVASARTGWTKARILAITLAFLLVAPFVLPEFQVFVLIEVFVFALFATSFNLLYGYTGLLSFGHALFYAGGAYGLAIFLRDIGPLLPAALGGVSPLVVFGFAGVAGVIAITLVAIPVGYLSVQLEEIYFAMITLAFGMGLYTVVLQNPGGLTNGSEGILVLLGSADVLGLTVQLGSRTTYYYFVLAVFLLSMYALWRIVASPFGAVCKSIRENPERAEAIGINVTRHQWLTFILSAMFTAIAGILMAPHHNIVSPEMAYWETSAVAVVSAVLGGPSVFLGPAFGAIAFRYLRWIITRVPALEAHWELAFGVLLIVVILFLNKGVSGGVYSFAGWLRRVELAYNSDGFEGVRNYIRESVQAKLSTMVSTTTRYLKGTRLGGN